MFGTAMTDGIINDDGKKVLTEPIVIVNALWNMIGNEFPFLNGHDHTKLLGWVEIFGIFSEPGLTRLLINISIAENDSEFKIVKEKYIKFRSNLYEKNKIEFDKLEGLISAKFKSDFYYIELNCISIISKNILFEVFPELQQYLDDDGLIKMSELEPIGEGVFKRGEFAIYAHNFFRRSFYRLNSSNIPFFRRLDQIEDKTRLRIRLDPDMIGLADTFKHSNEWEYWWGPKFDEDLTKIKTGETIHATTHDDVLLKTFFRWGEVKSDKVFEVEELPEKGINLLHNESDGLYGCRYAHSIFRPNINEFHFDGAIRGYLPEEYEKRLNSSLGEAPRKTFYTKLWRYDGFLSIIQWKELLTHYFRDNTLIGEYLSGKDDYLDERKVKENEKPKDKTKDHKKSIFTDLSIKMMFSFKEKKINTELGSSIIYKFEDLPYSIPIKLNEIFINESIQFTSQKGLEFQELGQKFCYISPIFISQQNDDISKFNHAIRSFMSYLKSSEKCEFICINLIFLVVDKLVKLSIIGQKQFIIQYFDLFEIENFKDYMQFKKWVKKILDFIYTFPPKEEKSLESNWISKHGFFKLPD
jgi:hypothetical protein